MAYGCYVWTYVRFACTNESPNMNPETPGPILCLNEQFLIAFPNLRFLSSSTGCFIGDYNTQT